MTTSRWAAALGPRPYTGCGKPLRKREVLMIAHRIFAAAGLLALAIAGPALAQGRDYGITVVNGTGTTIEYFQYSSCGTDSWLGDRLGGNEVISPGASRHFDMYDGIRSCCRDMRAKFVNGATRSRMKVDVCSESQWVVR